MGFYFEMALKMLACWMAQDMAGIINATLFTNMILSYKYIKRRQALQLALRTYKNRRGGYSFRAKGRCNNKSTHYAQDFYFYSNDINRRTLFYATI